MDNVKLRHLVLGYGEVGQAICKVLGQAMWKSTTSGNWDNNPVDVLHVCIPFKDKNSFKEAIAPYMEIAKLVIVHSSVPIGTCFDLGVVHSPVRGVHPNLEEGIRTFVKYFGGKDADKAAKIFFDLGIKTRILSSASTTEALKLWDTTQYGLMILLEKAIYRWCKRHNLNFHEIYTLANKDYNEGYVALGRPEVVRPYLKHIPGPIGGHCVVPNAKLLGSEYEFPEDLD